MSEKEEAKHQRLLLLDEFGGKIEGELKYHKSLYQYRYNTEEVNEEEWGFVREERGPTDRGFSSVLQSYEDLELVEETEQGNRRDFLLKDKGQKVAKGLRRGLSKLDDSFPSRLNMLKAVRDKNKNRSGSEIVEDDDVQEAKEKTVQASLDEI